MNADPTASLVAILALSALTYAMRSGGYLATATLGVSPRFGRLLRVAPGNLFVAVAGVAVAKGGSPVLAGSIATMAVMHLWKREWLALPCGAMAAALTAYFFCGTV